jgi:prepilin-type N-terminal cleavage/methylation domain-containing protein
MFSVREFRGEQKREEKIPMKRTAVCSGFRYFPRLAPRRRYCMPFAKKVVVMKLYPKSHSTQSAFTLVEIMIVVGIIALLAAIAVPNFLRARKRSQATRCLEDLRIIDAACDEYAIENNKVTGNSVAWTDVQLYVKTGSVLYDSQGFDLFGNAYNVHATFSVDSIPKLNSTTFSKLSDVAPTSFWSPYYP